MSIIRSLVLLVATAFSSTVLSPYSTPPVIAQGVPKAECRSDYGQIACGYNCISDYGKVKCAEWPGGVCKADYGQVVCGPPAPEGWLVRYSNSSNTGVYGAWAIQIGNWSGILRMQGTTGRLVLTQGRAAIEQRMALMPTNDGYMLQGSISATYVRTPYYADNLYVSQFKKGTTTVKSCDTNRNCTSATLVYLGK